MAGSQVPFCAMIVLAAIAVQDFNTLLFLAVASTFSESPSSASLDQRKRRGCKAALWRDFSTQRIKGHPTIFNMIFSVSIFFVMSVSFLIGGGVLLTVSLRQVQIKATYNDVDKLAPLTNAEREKVMQGLSAILTFFFVVSSELCGFVHCSSSQHNRMC
jgi:hypothetical protein